MTKVTLDSDELLGETVRNSINMSEKIVDNSIKVSGDITDNSLKMSEDMVTRSMNTVEKQLDHNRHDLRSKELQLEKEIERNNNLLIEGMEYKAKARAFETVLQIEDAFRQNLINFKEGLSRFERKIHEVNKEIFDESKALEELTPNYDDISAELKFQTRRYEEIQIDFTLLVNRLSELSEYKGTMPVVEFKKAVSRKNKEIKRSLDELEQFEEVMLKLELQRVLLFDKIKPLKNRIDALNHSIKYIEREKEIFNDSGLLILSKSSVVGEVVEIKGRKSRVKIVNGSNVSQERLIEQDK